MWIMSYVKQNAQYHILQRRKWDFIWIFMYWHLDQKAGPLYFQHLWSNIIKLTSWVIDVLQCCNASFRHANCSLYALCNWAGHVIIIHQPWKKAYSSMHIKNVIGRYYRKNGNMLLFTAHHILWGYWYFLYNNTLPIWEKKVTINKIHSDFLLHLVFL